jgi:hypothetical protein
MAGRQHFQSSAHQQSKRLLISLPSDTSPPRSPTVSPPSERITTRLAAWGRPSHNPVASTLKPMTPRISDTLVGQYIQLIVLFWARLVLPTIVRVYVAGEFIGRFYYKRVVPFFVQQVRPALQYAFTIN